MTRQIIVEEVGRRNVQIVALEATVDHDVLRFPALFEKNWIFRKPQSTSMVNIWKRGVRARAAKKQKTTRELICRHDSRRISNVGLKQTRCCANSEATNARKLRQ